MVVMYNTYCMFCHVLVNYIHCFAFLQVAIVAMLLNNSADWNLRDKDGDTILHFNCMNDNPNGNYIATLQFLLSTPANALINAQNSRGDTPLLVAIRYI